MTLKSSILYGLRIILPGKQAASNGRKSLFGAMWCIALCIVPLIVVLTVADGMIDGITNRIIGLSSYHLQVASYASTNLENINNLASDLKTIPGVTGAFVERQGVALATSSKGRTGATIRSVSSDIFSQNHAFATYMTLVDGEANFPTDKSAVIGSKLAKELDLHIGDTLRLISTKTSYTGKVSPKIAMYTVSGIVSSGYQEIDAMWVFIPLESGFSFLSTSSSQILIGIETEDPFGDSFGQIHQEMLHSLPAGFRLYSWKDLNASQYENYSSTKMLLMLIMFLILLIASVNISSALVMVVLERSKEIAILKSIGASSGGITLSFLIAGTICGICGILIGMPLGLLCAVSTNEIIMFFETCINWFSNGPVKILDPTYYLESIPIVIPVKELCGIGLATLLLSVLVSLIPAVKAGKEKPLQLLRKS
jgi:lipoprotein-releasing system permease protein